jgi:excisionase family DNA binding protein
MRQFGPKCLVKNMYIRYTCPRPVDHRTLVIPPWTFAQGERRSSVVGFGPLPPHPVPEEVVQTASGTETRRQRMTTGLPDGDAGRSLRGVLRPPVARCYSVTVPTSQSCKQTPEDVLLPCPGKPGRQGGYLQNMVSGDFRLHRKSIANLIYVCQGFLGYFLTKVVFLSFFGPFTTVITFLTGVFVVSVSQSPRMHNGRSVLTTAEASQRAGLSRSYILHLLSNKRIEGVQLLGREWMVYADSLDAFLAQPRSKGKKGERGPRKKREIRHTEHGERVLLSTAEASARSGYRQDSLVRLLRSGRIKGEKVGRTWFIYEDSLLAYRQRKHPKGKPTRPATAEPSPDE